MRTGRRGRICLPVMESLRRWARSIKRDVVALYFAGRTLASLWFAKAVAVAVPAYALSPVTIHKRAMWISGLLAWKAAAAWGRCSCSYQRSKASLSPASLTSARTMKSAVIGSL